MGPDHRDAAPDRVGHSGTRWVAGGTRGRGRSGGQVGSGEVQAVVLELVAQLTQHDSGHSLTTVVLHHPVHHPQLLVVRELAVRELITVEGHNLRHSDAIVVDVQPICTAALGALEAGGEELRKLPLPVEAVVRVAHGSEG